MANNGEPPLSDNVGEGEYRGKFFTALLISYYE